MQFTITIPDDILAGVTALMHEANRTKEPPYLSEAEFVQNFAFSLADGAALQRKVGKYFSLPEPRYLEDGTPNPDFVE